MRFQPIFTVLGVGFLALQQGLASDANESHIFGKKLKLKESLLNLRNANNQVTSSGISLQAPVAATVALNKRQFEKHDFILELDATNFEEITKDKSFIIKFYSPTCGACVSLEPVWVQSVKEYMAANNANPNKKIYFASVNCSKEFSFCRDKGIRGWPTLWGAYKSNKLVDRAGSAKQDVILSFFDKASTAFQQKREEDQPAQPIQPPMPAAPAKSEQKEPAQAKGSLVLTDSSYPDTTKRGVWFVKFYSPRCGFCVKLAPIWEAVSDKYSAKLNAADIHFAELDCLSNSKTCNSMGIEGYPTLNLYTNGKLVKEFTGYTEEALSKYAEDLLTTYGKAGNQKSDVVDNSGDSLTPLLGDTPPLDIPGLDENSNPKNLAADSNTNSSNNRDIDNENKPISIINQDSYSISPYARDMEFFNTAGINTAGKLQPLEANSFKEQTKNTIWLIYFYKPGCEGCAELEEELKDLSLRLKGQVNVGSVDCSKHSSTCADFKAIEFPSIKLTFRGMSLDYNRIGRKADDIAGFVLTNRATSRQINDYTYRQNLRDSVIDRETFKIKSKGLLYLYIDPLILNEGRRSYNTIYSNKKSFLQRAKMASIGAFSSRRFFVVEDEDFALEIAEKILGKRYESAKDLPEPMLVKVNNGEYTKYPKDVESISAMAKWIHDGSKMLYQSKVKKLDSSNSEQLLTGYDYLILAITKSDSDPQTPEIKHVLSQVSADFKLQFSGDLDFVKKSVEFAYIDGLVWNKYLSRVFSINQAKLPAFVILEPKLNNYYTINGKHASVNPSHITRTNILNAIQSIGATNEGKNSASLLEKHNTAGALKNSARVASKISNQIKTTMGDSVLYTLAILIGFAIAMCIGWSIYRRKAQGGSYLPVHKSQ